MRSDPTLWILARASGVLAYLLLSTTVLAGLAVRARPLRSVRPAAAVDLHRFLSLLALGAVALHGAALSLDAVAPVSLRALLVPGSATYRPLWTGLGVASAELMLLIHLSFSVRRRIGPRNWRRLHYLTFLVFAAATAHGLASGTDSARPWAAGMYLGAAGAVVGLTAWRVAGRRARGRPAPDPAGARRT